MLDNINFNWQTMASTLTLLTTRRHCFGSCPISRATKEPKTDDKGVLLEESNSQTKSGNTMNEQQCCQCLTEGNTS